MANPTNPDFSDSRTVLCRADDTDIDGPRGWADSNVGYFQSCNGPTFLVIGRQAPDDALSRAMGRFGVPLAVLIAFRDGEDQRLEVAHE